MPLHRQFHDPRLSLESSHALLGLAVPARPISPAFVRGTSPCPSTPLQGTSGLEVVEALRHPLRHGLLTLTNPDSGVVLLLVGLVLTPGVADLGPEVVDVVEDVVAISMSAEAAGTASLSRRLTGYRSGTTTASRCQH